MDGLNFDMKSLANLLKDPNQQDESDGEDIDKVT